MKLPNKIIIFSIEYKIQYEENLISEEHSLIKGQIDYRNNLIRLEKNRPEKDILVTLLHEIIHAIFDTLGIGKYVENNQETFIDSLSVGLIDTLLRNNFIKME
jgi:Zn-dependent peptidase ImmA (M78 family)